MPKKVISQQTGLITRPQAIHRVAVVFVRMFVAVKAMIVTLFWTWMNFLKIINNL